MSYNHSHSHRPKQDFSSAFFFGILLNTIFIIAEIIYGFAANSLALLADAGHNASDVLGLFLSLGATILAKRKSSQRFTYGLQSSTIMAALANALILLVAVGGIVFEALQRFQNPEIVTDSKTVIWVAFLGIIINGATAWFFLAGSKKDLNIRGAFLHMISDALISLGVVISGIIMMKTGWVLIDPIMSILIAAAILFSTWSLLKDSIKLALHAVPKEIDSNQVRKFLKNLEGVEKIQDLHIWAMSTSETALTAQLLMTKIPEKNFLRKVEHELEHQFNIGHSTIQIEVSESDSDFGAVKRHQH
jgi:cobalt-zinc-cadmium efflux system protein